MGGGSVQIDDKMFSSYSIHHKMQNASLASIDEHSSVDDIEKAILNVYMGPDCLERYRKKSDYKKYPSKRLTMTSPSPRAWKTNYTCLATDGKRHYMNDCTKTEYWTYNPRLQHGWAACVHPKS